jgi:hypothetical protein
MQVCGSTLNPSSVGAITQYGHGNWAVILYSRGNLDHLIGSLCDQDICHKIDVCYLDTFLSTPTSPCRICDYSPLIS